MLFFNSIGNASNWLLRHNSCSILIFQNFEIYPHFEAAFTFYLKSSQDFLPKFLVFKEILIFNQNSLRQIEFYKTTTPHSEPVSKTVAWDFSAPELIPMHQINFCMLTVTDLLFLKILDSRYYYSKALSTCTTICNCLLRFVRKVYLF